jgi:hypothetical protein
MVVLIVFRDISYTFITYLILKLIFLSDSKLLIFVVYITCIVLQIIEMMPWSCAEA